MKVLITGGSSDIGLAVARTLRAAGHEPVVTASGDAGAAKVRAAWGEAPPPILRFDLKAPAASADALAELLAAGLGGAVLNACERVPRLAPLHEQDDDDIARYLDHNVYGNLWLLKRLTGAFAAAGAGRLVLVSSISAIAGTAQYPVYCAAKAALEGAFRNLAVDYGPAGVSANIVRPGIIMTERNRDLWSEPAYQRLTSRLIPSARLGRPAEVAAAVAVFFAADSYLNGAELNVAGGLPLLAGARVPK